MWRKLGGVDDIDWAVDDERDDSSQFDEHSDDEARRMASDGNMYTRDEFLDYYGQCPSYIFPHTIHQISLGDFM